MYLLINVLYLENHSKIKIVEKYSSVEYNKVLECGPMPNVMAALPNIGGALWSTPQRLADAQYRSAVQ